MEREDAERERSSCTGFSKQGGYPPDCLLILRFHNERVIKDTGPPCGHTTVDCCQGEKGIDVVEWMKKNLEVPCVRKCVIYGGSRVSYIQSIDVCVCVCVCVAGRYIIRQYDGVYGVVEGTSSLGLKVVLGVDKASGGGRPLTGAWLLIG